LCKRRWFLEDRGVVPIRIPRALDFGSLFHAALDGYGNEILENGATTDYSRAVQRGLVMLTKSAEKRGRLLAEAVAAATDQFVSQRLADEQAEMQKTFNEVAAVFNRYADRWFDEDSRRYEVLRVERKFEFRVPRKTGGWTELIFCGKIDRLVRDHDQHDALFIFESKTTSDRQANTWLKRLQFDGQPVGYVWAARQEFPEVSGVIYDISRSRLPSIPEITQKGRVSAARDVDTTYELFVEALAKAGQSIDDPAPGDQKLTDSYNSILTRLERERGDGTWFHREIWPVLDDDIEWWLTDMIDLSKEFGKGPFPRNLGACNLQSRPCPFRSFEIQRGTEDAIPMGYARVERNALQPRELCEDEDEL
jgi:hypothetical protein